MNEFSHQLESTNIPPLCFKIVKWLQQKNIRGGYRLEQLCRSKGLFNVKVRYSLGHNNFIDVPIDKRSYSFAEIIDYEHDSIDYVSTIISHYNQPFILLDCGADIGLISARLASACPDINRIIAFEPNQNSYAFLEGNMQLLAAEAEAKNIGVSDFTGKAELQYPNFDASDHAAFIVPSKEGSIDVAKIDDLGLPQGSCILLKVDVEGAEFSVIQGALDTLTQAKHFIILFEAHYKQVERTQVDPTTILSYIRGLSPCTAKVVEHTDTEIDLDKPFFDQFPKEIFNICVHSDN